MVSMDLTKLALPLFAFYVLVFCTFIPEIIGCKLQTLLKHNMIAKHIIGFVALFFLVVMAGPQNADQNLIPSFFFAVGVYVWFFITTRNPYPSMIAVLVLLLVVYLLGTRRDKVKKEGDLVQEKLLYKIQLTATIIAFIISVIGFGFYFKDKYKEYKHHFVLKTFLFGKKSCKNN